MAKKGLDTTFLHYGIRKEDMSLIETLCIEHKLEFDWVKGGFAQRVSRTENPQSGDR